MNIRMTLPGGIWEKHSGGVGSGDRLAPPSLILASDFRPKQSDTIFEATECIYAEDWNTHLRLYREHRARVVDALESYIYRYPLMIPGATVRTATNVPDATTRLGGAPLNQFESA